MPEISTVLVGDSFPELPRATVMNVFVPFARADTVAQRVTRPVAGALPGTEGSSSAEVSSSSGAVA